MTHRWDPERYLAYADERGRPFVELLARVRAEEPERVVDLGCGPGNLTALLRRRWPEADVLGVDSSAEMIERARQDVDGVRFEVGDLREWAGLTRGLDTPSLVPRDDYSTAGLVDVLVSNATLQWVPGHLELLPALVAKVRPGGTFAFQVPGNFGEPSHTIRDELAAEAPYAEGLETVARATSSTTGGGVATPSAHDAATYLRALTALGCEVDAWETTYLHVLHGADPVFTWVSGTGARPTLQALPDDLRPAFEDEFKRRLRAAYPDDGHGVVLPFRRVFLVAVRSKS
ncbi:methyltransferase domain-containing protein [Nocardioides panacisoli]|uniref:Trans-aconitate 2-methyltransferase n=1 Tax=Nocardioides panacisoli TaxID=627624 RepID=A0ABP7HUW1_9ACTN